MGFYVFCLARERAVEAVVGYGLSGDAPLRARVHGEIAAIYCEVPLQEWTGEEGEAHLKDLGWLGPRALRHEEVIEQMMRASPVMPLRFGCLFSSLEELDALLRRERARIAAFLEKAEHEEEWSLQGVLDFKACEEAMFAADPRVAKLPASAGARYLMEQKLRKDAARAARGWIQEAEAMVARALEGLVLARRPLRLPSRSAESPTVEGVFHWALLVPRGAEAELARRLDPLAEPLAARGLSLTARGPWPTYNFAPHFGGEPEHGSEEQSLG
ncbi:GvpL/GvpF family gas vesicle protein [Hyalangium rubrum]|uniref:GvpL/GvpF family gas vesicle protein n=1 Tax=Hyalangium rubrum TaxID=3103134 RepID=A0ABU5HJU2_9BACT|nr:GvpL/GvpF family gas vesicle protein [Hyalangium sp. s54d21]MDY7233113.1 GvpL/GvpF family gas vesicle protein [Hyalangium sp. s54d21]